MGEPLRMLLIGGSGFMGGRAAGALSEAGHRISVLSRNERPMPAGVEPLVADRRDPGSLARSLEGRRFDLTVDFLAYSSEDIERLLLVPYAALGRYIMISTGQVYLITEGASPPFREEQSDGAIISEPIAGTRDHREWSYGVAKRRAERALLGLQGSHGVRAVALRLPIVQGEADGSLRLWAYLERLLDGGPILLPDGGGQPVRHVYAGDVARTLVWLADRGEPRGTFYNLCQADVLSLRAFLELVARAAGAAPRFVEASWDEIRGAGLDESISPYAGRWCSLLDPSRAAAEWGWSGTRMEDYLPGVVGWHLENRPTRSHPGYAHRAREIELAARLAVAR